MHRIALLLAWTSLALLAFAGSAAAALPALPLPAISALDEEAEEPEEVDAEEEFDACEEEESEECEETEVASGPGDRHSDASAECVLRSANARAMAKGDRLKLTIGYTTSEPVTATIKIRNGSTHIGSFKRHLGRSGVLRFTKSLGEKRIAKQTVIRIELPGGGAGCPTLSARAQPKRA